MLLMYVGYVVLMYYNRRLYKKLTGKELVSAGEMEDTEEENETANGTAETAANGNGENGEYHRPPTSPNKQYARRTSFR